MWSKPILSSLSLFVVFGVINAADESGCIEVEPVANLDPDQAPGLWYLFAKTPSDKFQNAACLTLLFIKPEEDSTQKLVTLWKDTSDNSTHISLKNRKTDLASGTGETSYGDSYTVAGIDYKKWVFTIGCYKSEQKSFVYILTRKPNFSYLELLPILDISSEYDINLFDLQQFDQKNCPSDWSKADEVDEKDFKLDDVKDELIAKKLFKDGN